MSGESEEKTLPPTRHKLKKAREKGQVVTSRETLSSVSSLAVLLYLFARREAIWRDLKALFLLEPAPGLTLMQDLHERARLAMELATGILAPIIALVIALAVLMLVERGLIVLDDPMGRHWPSFRAGTTVRQVLSHTSGLVTFEVPRPAEAWADWDLLCADLAAAEPEWPPGTVAAEHALTYGHLLGELVRRVDGRTPARFVA